MISGLPSIVVIDDDQTELDRIKSAFFESGIPCLPIQYINDDPDNHSGIDHVDITSWSSPRIVVSDLNLTEMSDLKSVSLVGPFATMLKKLDLSGPYLLCVWSKLEQNVEEVVRILEERHQGEFTLPIHVAVISKNELLHDVDKLKEKLQQIISENSLFGVLLNWESRASEAARSAINSLYSLAQSNSVSKTIDDQKSELKKILAAIGNESIGHKNAKDDPALAMDYGLIPVLEDKIRSMTSIDLNEYWKDAVPEIGRPQEIEDAIKSELNAFYHIEEVAEDFPKNARGVFVKFDYSYLDDADKQKKFENRIGRPIENMLHDEFLARLKMTAENRDFMARGRNETILGFLEVSATCDYAQKKVKFPRYLLGALIPEEFISLTMFKTSQGQVKDRAHDGIYRLPRIMLGGRSYIVKFSFKYQFGAQPIDNQWFGDSLFRVRDQVLSAVIFNCSQYGSRPGIVSF